MICSWCGAEFTDSLVFDEHQNLHRDLDFLNNTIRQESEEETVQHVTGNWSPVPGPSNKDTGNCLTRNEENKRQESSSTSPAQTDTHTIHERERFFCDRCSKSYAWKKSLARHIRSEHTFRRHSCSKCKKEFHFHSDKSNHEKSCNGQLNFCCVTCGKLCATERGLRQHQTVHQMKRKLSTDKEPFHEPKRVKPHYKCRRCSDTFDNRRELYLHGMRTHFQTGKGLQPRPWDNGTPPWMTHDGEVDDRLRDVYQANAPLILEQNRLGPVYSTYNFPVENDISLQDLAQFVDNIYESQQVAFKINLRFGVILRHRDTGRYRYFRPFDNVSVLEVPFYVTNRERMRQLQNRLRKLDVLTEVLRQRLDTKWVVVLLSNVRFTLFHTHYALGNGVVPDFVKNNKAIYSLDVNRQTGKPYKDNLCAFRCLAVHRGFSVKSIEGATKEYFRQWSKTKLHDFKGISFEDFPSFESTFQVNVEIYRMDESGNALTVYRSRRRYDDTMYLNVYENHLSYITDFKMYANKYECEACHKLWPTAFRLQQHAKSCTDKTNFLYPGGFYTLPKTIFEELFDVGYCTQDVVFPWFIVYDFESILSSLGTENDAEKLKWTHQHIPVSVSVCSNVPGYNNPVCFVDSDLDQLLAQMITYMKEIVCRTSELAGDNWGWIVEGIENEMKELKNFNPTDYSESEMKTLAKLKSRLEAYMRQVPVLGFNSANYDLNLIKSKLARHLDLQKDESAFTIKKNNAYTCISSEDFRFLDVTNYLAAGTSYAKFLKAYGVEEQKGFFPYEWFDDIEKLEAKNLPPHHAFHSRLRGTNISRDEYSFCQRVWEEQRMIKFKDFLVWYNNLDVAPFVTAVERMQEFYFDKQIDLFKTAVSVPGIARTMLFRKAKESGAEFCLMDEKNKDLYNVIKRNIVGGPSIIYHREAIKGKTKIRGGKTCCKVLGFDANALYLWAIGQKMPVGSFVRRRSENNFRAEIRDRYVKAFNWMNYLNSYEHCNIKHARNNGKEKKVGPYPVDGFDPESNTVYQFQGCYFHGHDCIITRNVKNKEWRKGREKKIQRTRKISEFIRERGYALVEMWECEFYDFCKTHPTIYDLINHDRPEFYQKYKQEVTSDKVLEAVRSEELFGMIEVDIEVPDVWDGEFKDKMTLSPWEYFSEMSPLFCTSDVPFESIGSHMQKHAISLGLPHKPRRLLIGGMRARQILLATPLLKWYLDHGLKVTKIYQVVEFKGDACFREFVKDVSNARRDGDTHPDKAVIADTMKVVGNSGYGSLIMDKTKHRSIKYVQGEKEVCLSVNQTQFRNLTCLEAEEEMYEIEMAKRKIKLDLPIQLGYFILRYAKLRMLAFNYNFLDVFVDRCDYQLLEMDTDSNYLCLSAENFRDVVKPEKLASYDTGLRGFCTNEVVEADDVHHWLPRNCCSEHSNYDKRTPGLFKTEYEGDDMIGLCSKTYAISKSSKYIVSATRITAYRILRRVKRLKPRKAMKYVRSTRECKFSSKGISKLNVKAPWSIFQRVMKNQYPASGINRGFMAKRNSIFTYVQERRGFSYFYCKRKVLEDGISTEPLDITLSPI